MGAVSAGDESVVSSSAKHKGAEQSASGNTVAIEPIIIAKASVTIPASGASGSAGHGDVDSSSTKLKLQIVNRPNLDRMNKSERKAEEKRRKRARREEEIAKSEKRRRTAVAATDDALREAELRSRRRLQKLEIAEAMNQREERERKAREAEAERLLAAKMKFNASAWTGRLQPLKETQGFWLRKRAKLNVPSVFLSAIDTC
ncbi:hypothetical protein PINS_up014323 [Pythium insidiosum]|nr:hypothetical protein PINS_up014323 [Pythium insidiosum]